MALRIRACWIFVALVSNAALAQTPQGVQECPNCPAMLVVPAGIFMMGSSLSEAGRAEDEGPQRVVSVARFAVAQYEVTRGQFAAFVADSGYQSQGGNCWYWGVGSRALPSTCWSA